MAHDVLLAYLDYSIPFEIYTDASSRQLGAVITQNGRPIAYFSRKLTITQMKYSVTELELLSIVETLKEFKDKIKDATKRGTSLVLTEEYNIYKTVYCNNTGEIFEVSFIYAKGLYECVVLFFSYKT